MIKISRENQIESRVKVIKISRDNQTESCEGD